MTAVAAAAGAGSDPIKRLVIVDIEVSEEPDAHKLLETPDAKQDIVLIAYAIMSVEDGNTKVLGKDVFHVKPDPFQPLTSYFSSVTGIQNADVESASGLKDTLETFYAAVGAHFDDGHTAVITDGRKDLQDWLAKEAARRDIELRPFMQSFIDLRSAFKEFRPEFQGKLTMEGIGPEMGVDLKAKRCGLGEIECIGRVAEMMAIEGFKFTHAHLVSSTAAPDAAAETETKAAVVPKAAEATSTTSVPKATAIETVDVSDDKTGIEEDKEDLAGNAFTEANPFTAEPGSCIMMRGAPYDCSKQAVIDFFEDVRINVRNILICCTRDKRCTGDVYVEVNPEDWDKANALSGRKIGHRYIDLGRTTFKDYKNALHYMENELKDEVKIKKDYYTVKMRGLPFTASKNDLLNFIKENSTGADIGVLPEDVVMGRRRDGRPNGDAYVQVEKMEHQQRLEYMNRRSLGSRYLEVFKCHPNDMNDQHIFNSGDAAGMDGSAGGQDDGLCCKLMGLPYSAGVNEVNHFFEGQTIKDQGIVFKLNPDGRMSGIAFVTFATTEDRAAALLKDRQSMGSRYIEIQKCSPQEIVRATQQQGQGRGGYGGGYNQGGYNQGGYNRGGYNNGGGWNQGGGYQQQQQWGNQGGYNNGYGQQGGQQQQYDQWHRQASAYYEQQGRGEEFRQYSQQYAQQYGFNNGGGQQQGGYNQGHQGQSYQQQASGNPNEVWCKGLPFSASVEDVMTFFQNYNIGMHDVRMIMRQDDGRPSGMCAVTFPDREAAQDAVQKLNRQDMGGRYIELRL